MKKALFAIIVAGFWFEGYATDARVIALGGHDDFFMDEVSVFRNPADIGLYPDMLYGSLGVYRSSGSDSAAAGRSSAPADPFFGGIAAFPLTADTAYRARHSSFSLGAFFNRHDALLDYVNPHSGRYVGNSNDIMLTPQGTIDVMTGYTWAGGTAIGIGGYIASQSYTTGPVIDSETSLYKLNVGLRSPVGDHGAFEWSAGSGLLRAKGDSAGAGRTPIIVANDDAFFMTDARMFTPFPASAVMAVPQVRFSRITLYHGAVSLQDFTAGIGIDLPLTGGLFWAGLQYLYQAGSFFHDSSITSYGCRASFGLEHSIVGDWLVARVGGQKVFAFSTTTYAAGGPARSTFSDGLPSDDSYSDLLGLGLGFIIKARLRIDAVVSDNLPYTLGIASGGSDPYLISRVGATWRF